MVMLSKFKYGDLTEYGLERPTKGPFYLKKIIRRSSIIDVGTVEKIRTETFRYSIIPNLFINSK